MELYIIRHGQTFSNIKNIIQGQTEGELTELGKKQASLLGKKLSKIKFNEIYCSDLNRAKQTLEQILKESNFEKPNIIYTEKLREINVNALEGHPSEEEDKIRYSGEIKYRETRTGKNDESFIDVFYRTGEVIDNIIKKYLDNNYDSGVNKDNYLEINRNQGEIEENVLCDMIKKGELTINNVDDKDFIKILIVMHAGALWEVINNFLYRMNKKLVRRINWENTALNKIFIYPKDNNKGVKNNNDLNISFNIFNDSSHLKE